MEIDVTLDENTTYIGKGQSGLFRLQRWKNKNTLPMKVLILMIITNGKTPYENIKIPQVIKISNMLGQHQLKLIVGVRQLPVQIQQVNQKYWVQL